MEENNNLVPFVSQWMTIQPSLFSGLDDELGELDADQQLFVRVCSWALSEQSFVRYRWCGNGRPPKTRSESARRTRTSRFCRRTATGA